MAVHNRSKRLDSGVVQMSQRRIGAVGGVSTPILSRLKVPFFFSLKEAFLARSGFSGQALEGEEMRLMRLREGASLLRRTPATGCTGTQL